MPELANLPAHWKPLPGKTLKAGGQATVVRVQHEDGREGVFREMRISASNAARDRFCRELQILTEAVRHRAIVKLFDWNGDTERPWYISELGDPFNRWWRRQKKQTAHDPSGLVERAVGVLAELASALSVCHASGVVHRDIKPSNLVMKRGVAEPWPVLIDFGIAHDEAGSRLTQLDEAVGNERFSPDVMRFRLEEVSPWLDVFDLAQLLTWMLDEGAPKAHWRRPIHWKHARYRGDIPEDSRYAIRAFTAACANETTAPANGEEVGELLARLFHRPALSQGAGVDLKAIQDARTRGEVRKLLAEAEIEEEVQSAAPLAERVYADVRATLLSVLQAFSGTDLQPEILYDNPFLYRLEGATDLIYVSVGSAERNIRFRIKSKVVPRRAPTQAAVSNHAFWRRHMAEDAICFTFAMEGGVEQAHDAGYLTGRWLTIRRDGALFLHPLSAAFGNFAHNDLGGSAEGAGVLASVAEVRAFIMSVFENESYWEYIASG